MIGGFQYDITLGPYQQERLHAMTGAFVIHNNFGALSAAVMIGHYMEDCSTILHCGLINRSDNRC